MKFIWNEAYEDACQELKVQQMTKQILTLLDIAEPYVVVTNASLQGLGCVIIQNG